ncbi:MAG: class I SAM-dependent methyltransferase, partial [Bacteroidetes bacterium]|nr:class I SAM-dependent methyltransferase [Bacteroidota bacterium]
STTAFAGTIPQNYDTYMGPMLFEPYAIDIAERFKNIPARNKVLEIACGTGRVTKHLYLSLPEDANFVATDLNKDMIEIAKQRNVSTDIDWQVADAQALPFADESFDVVVCQFGYMFMQNKEKAFAESYRVLKPGGMLLFNCWDSLANNDMFNIANNVVANFFPDNPPVFFNIPFSFYDTELMNSLLEKTGFKNITIELVQKESVSTPENAAKGMVEGSPIFVFINEHAPSLLNDIRNTVEKEIGEKYGTNPLTAPMQAWVAQAEK